MPNELENRLDVSVKQADENFRAFTRSSCFSLSLGVREIRMLKEQPWSHAWAMSGEELATLQRLLDKGLLLHTYGQSPELSEAGKLVRKLLTLSKHIVISA